jgi:hypothetical protein
MEFLWITDNHISNHIGDVMVAWKKIVGFRGGSRITS